MNALAQRLGIEFPLLQAGMGGVAGPRLAAATAEAGAGGVIGLYRASPGAIVELISATRQLTQRPFGVNLIPELMAHATLAAQTRAVLQATDPGVFFTFFGLPDRVTRDLIKQAGRAMLVMVGDVKAMQAASALGADAVVLQGIEAGGHLLGELALDDLIDQALAHGCKLPLVAAGGITSGDRFRQLHDRGIAGCLCGTLFVSTTESQAHARYKQRLVQAQDQDTVITGLFEIGWPGRRHRVLRNRLTDHTGGPWPRTFIARTLVQGVPHPLPRYSAMVPTEQTEGLIDELPMYCGQSVAGIGSVVPVSERVQRFVAAFHAAGPAGR